MLRIIDPLIADCNAVSDMKSVIEIVLETGIESCMKSEMSEQMISYLIIIYDERNSVATNYTINDSDSTNKF